MAVYVSEPFSQLPPAILSLTLIPKDQVFFGVVLGSILGAYLVFELDRLESSISNTLSTGFAFSYLMKFSHRYGFIDRESYVAQYVALAIFITGVVDTIGSDDLLAAFAAGKHIRRV